MLPLRGKRLEPLQSVQVNTAIISWEKLLTSTANGEAESKNGNSESMFQEWAAMPCACKMKRPWVKKK